jgi:hypothetical protein
MAIGVYYRPEGLTFAQYAQFYDRLERYLQEHGLEVPEGALHLSLFGDDGQLAGFEVWDSEESFRKFEPVMGPMLAEVGVRGVEPQILPIHRLAQSRAEIPWIAPAEGP